MLNGSLPQAHALKPLENGHLRLHPDACVASEIVLSTIVINQTPAPRKEFTTATERIHANARTLAVLFNHTEVTEAVVILAMLLDEDGIKELEKRHVHAEATYATCLKALFKLRRAQPGKAGEVESDEVVKQVLASARARADEREADINLVAVTDLAGAILDPRRRDRDQGLATVLPPSRGARGRLFSSALVVAAWTAFAGALAGAVWFGLERGLLDWAHFGWASVVARLSLLVA